MQSSNNNKYYIRSLLDKDLVLEVDPKGKVTIETYTAAPSQQWEILERVNNSNNQVEHCIVNVANKQCLHVKEKSHLFSKTRRAVTKKDSAFIWRRTDQIIECLLYANEKKRYLLDVKSESTAPGTHVIVYEENGGRSNQRFIFEPIIAKAATSNYSSTITTPQQQQQQQIPVASMYPQPLVFTPQLQQQSQPTEQQQQHAYQSVNNVNIVLLQQQEQQPSMTIAPAATNYAELLVPNPYNFDTTFERDVLQRMEKDGNRLPPKPFVAVYQQMFAQSFK